MPASGSRIIRSEAVEDMGLAQGYYLWCPDSTSDPASVALVVDWDWMVSRGDDNVSFIAHAREDVPALADAVEQLVEENERLEAKIEELEDYVADLEDEVQS